MEKNHGNGKHLLTLLPPETATVECCSHRKRRTNCQAYSQPLQLHIVKRCRFGRRQKIKCHSKIVARHCKHSQKYPH